MTVQLVEKQSLTKILSSITSTEKMEDFLKGILTTKEYRDITQRLEILRLLKLGVSHREISEKLGVGVATVTRGSKELQKGRFAYIKAI